jgi:hypothetical protein
MLLTLQNFSIDLCRDVPGAGDVTVDRRKARGSTMPMHWGVQGLTEHEREKPEKNKQERVS